MKLMNKLFAVIMLFGMSSVAFGFDWTINNKTNKPVTVTLKTGYTFYKSELVISETQKSSIEKGKTHKFSFVTKAKEQGRCLVEIEVSVEGSKPVTLPLDSLNKEICENAVLDLIEKSDLIEQGNFAVHVTKEQASNATPNTSSK